MKGNKLNWLTPKTVIIDEGVDTTKNKIEIYSKKQDKIIFDYIGIEEITDEMLVMAKIESVLNERPQYITQETIDETVKIFDEHYLLIVNWKELW